MSRAALQIRLRRAAVAILAAAVFVPGLVQGEGYDGPEPEQADIAWIAKGEFCEPETVIELPDSTLLVSNVCGYNDLGTGFLSLLDADGQILDWRAVDGLDSPLGMALLADTLYVVDRNRVRRFLWPGFEVIDVVDLDSRVANDIAVDETGRMLVTDTAQGVLFAVSADGVGSILPDAPVAFNGANGIALDETQLLVGGERLWRVDRRTGKGSTLGAEWLTDIDGIEIEADGTIQVTPVGGPLVRLFRDGSWSVLGGDGVSSANHGWAPQSGLALIPTGYDNTVIAIRVPTVP